MFYTLLDIKNPPIFYDLEEIKIPLCDKKNNLLEYLNFNESKQKKDAEKFEIAIDKILTQKSVTINSSVSISAPNGMTFSHFELLKPRYIAVGWKDVVWNFYYDQNSHDDYTTIKFKL